MSFGPTSQEKQQIGTLNTISQGQQDVAGTAGARGGKTFKQFEKSLTPAMDYWRAILSGDPVALMGAAGPSVSAINKQYAGVEKGLSAIGPRDITGRDRTALETQKAGTIGNFLAGLPGQAAGQLEGIAQLLAGLSTGQSGLGLQGLQGASQTTGNVLNQLVQMQASENAFFGSLAEGIGGIAAAAIPFPHPK